MSVAKNQGRIWPKGVMSREQIKRELQFLNKTYDEISHETGISYDVVRGTIAGRKRNAVVLQYLTNLGIKHGRTPSPSRKAS
ncbi:hypothetical protein [Leptospira interrogans]|uniref:hypothetical protein n=1 Tax=Leptospira interrogans TaxID=173 RepID=UPI0004AC48D2|nr:hypothetical protein [Leptospira interrogans]